jgi:hypothetical protein
MSIIIMQRKIIFGKRDQSGKAVLKTIKLTIKTAENNIVVR